MCSDHRFPPLSGFELAVLTGFVNAYEVSVVNRYTKGTLPLQERTLIIIRFQPIFSVRERKGGQRTTERFTAALQQHLRLCGKQVRL